MSSFFPLKGLRKSYFIFSSILVNKARSELPSLSSLKVKIKILHKYKIKTKRLKNVTKKLKNDCMKTLKKAGVDLD